MIAYINLSISLRLSHSARKLSFDRIIYFWFSFLPIRDDEKRVSSRVNANEDWTSHLENIFHAEFSSSSRKFFHFFFVKSETCEDENVNTSESRKSLQNERKCQDFPRERARETFSSSLFTIFSFLPCSMQTPTHL